MHKTIPAGCLFLLVIGSGPEAWGEILKGPYLQNVKPDGITVMWESDQPTTGIVQYGPTAELGLAARETRAGRIHEVVLSGLPKETLHHYRVFSGRDASPVRTFRTAVWPDSPFQFVYYGDNKNGPHMHRRNAGRIAAEEPHLVLQCGDMVNRGNVHSQWGRLFFTPARELIDHVPIYPALGNHERNAEAYFAYFSLPGNESWYSFDYGNAHFTVLDSNPSFLKPGSPQVHWLVEDLRTSRAQWKFVSFHHPPFSAGGAYYSSRRIELKSLLHPIFERHGVDVVFNGHDHDYERTRPIVSRSGARPVTYVVNGNGGTPMRYVGRRDWTVVARRVFGYTLVRLDGSRLELEGKTVDGEVIDRLVIDKADPAAEKAYLASALRYEDIVDPVEAVRLFEEGEELEGAEALARFSRAFALDPTFCEALVEMAKATRELGREDLAVEQLQRAIELMPVYPDSYEELAEIHAGRGRYEDAIRLLADWGRVEPDQADPLEALAELHARQGRTEEAVAALRRALQIVPSDAGLHQALARSYRSLGRRAEARAHYQEAMDWTDAEDTETLQALLREVEALDAGT